MEERRVFYYYGDKNPLIEIHTADLHFGAMDPKVQYDILMEQMVNKIRDLQFDVFFINGDIFHHKFMSNSDTIMYASLFIDEVVRLCMSKNATLVLLHGTASHDADQLKLFYHYIGSGVDIRIVETTRFEIIKGIRVLCIPEEYNKGYDYYSQFLYFSGQYDMAVLHGAVKGSIYGCDEANLSSIKAPVFDINCFRNCMGPIICGHVHVAGCYQKDIYYSGSPLRWRFGEEQTKGFIICLYNPNDYRYYINFEEITSFRYDTIDLNNMINYDPKEIINYILQLKTSGIDYIKIRFNTSNEHTDIVKRYFSDKSNITIDVEDSKFQETIRDNQKNNDEFKDYDYLLDTNLSPYEIFSRYVNQSKGYQFITTDELIKILSE